MFKNPHLKKTKVKHFTASTKLTGFGKKTSDSSSSVQKKRSNFKKHSFRNFWLSIRVYLLIGIISIVGGLVIYQSVRMVLKIRANSRASLITSHEKSVIGFEDVPVFADSTYGVAEFVFKNNLHHESVQQLLAKGCSIYRLPANVPGDKVSGFYKEKLPTLGWTYVMDVPLEAEDMMYGQYWVRNGIGIRIYSKINDIWYQKLSENDARSGLTNEVQWKIERDAILAQSDNYDLLPDFPWKLKLPSNYTVSYSLLTTYDLDGFDTLDEKKDKAELEADQKVATFKTNTSNDYVILEPFAIFQGGFVNEYLDIYARMRGLQILGSRSVSSGAGDSIEANVQFIGFYKGFEDESEEEDDENDDDSLPEENEDNTENTEVEDSNENSDHMEITDEEPPEYKKVLLMLHDDRKVVYALSLVGDSEEAEELYDYIKTNIEISVPGGYRPPETED